MFKDWYNGISVIFPGSLKYVIGWVFVFLVRLLPFRPPNVEPVMTTLMPFSKRFGAVGGFLFAALSVALFDLVVGKIGMWTLLTAVTYGVIGILAFYFFKNRASTAWDYAAFAVIGTILYDALTGLTVGPLFFGQSFTEAFIGQIPFTIYHLVGNVLFSAVLSPVIYRLVVENKSLEIPFVLNYFKVARKHL